MGSRRGVNLSSKRIKQLRDDERITIADLRMQIGIDPMKRSTSPIETKSQINRLGRSVQKQVDQSTPGGRRGREIKQSRLRKRPTD